MFGITSYIPQDYMSVMKTPRSLASMSHNALDVPLAVAHESYPRTCNLPSTEGLVVKFLDIVLPPNPVPSSSTSPVP